MAGEFGTGASSYPVLRFAAILKAARDFGLEREVADAIALRFDPRRPQLDALADALAAALLEQRALAVPDAV